jgi:hypothetical protein
VIFAARLYRPRPKMTRRSETRFIVSIVASTFPRL